MRGRITGNSSPRHPHLLQALGQADERHVDAELIEHGARGIDLRQPAVDDDQPGRVGEAPGLAGLGIDGPGDDGNALDILDLLRSPSSGLTAPLLGDEAFEPAGEDLVHGGGVVSGAAAVLAAHSEASVVGLAGRTVLEDDHGADLVGALGVGDVVALDAQGRLGQVEGLGELIEG